MLLEALSSQISTRIERLEHFARTASKRYFVFSIAKRNGGKRWIAHPSRSLKLIQRWLNARVIKKLKVHQSAKAYQTGSSIRENALVHVDSNFTLRLDFKDFFPSFTTASIRKFIANHGETFGGWSERDTTFFLDIVCREGRLTIGAPSSPFLTNAIMYSFDIKLADFCDERGLLYTRYADDLFISACEPDRLEEARQFVKSLSSEFPYASLEINDDKTAFLSRRYRRRITGLIVTSDRRLSLGRHRKREIKALVHQYSSGNLDLERLPYLKGLIAFAYDSDPPFFVALTHKYGRSVINDLIGKDQATVQGVLPHSASLDPPPESP